MDSARMALILWARHGENSANLTRTLSYRVFDGELTERGRHQASDLAARLAANPGPPVGQIFASPLLRARQTADIVAHLLGLPVVAELEDLRELNVGDLDGRSDPAAWTIYANVLAAWRAGEVQARFPGGEDCRELGDRLRRALAIVAGQSGDVASLVVAHGGALRAALPSLAGFPDPGADMTTGSFAALGVSHSEGVLRIDVISWPAATGL
jgi:broad specificity phosphatase PhoE